MKITITLMQKYIWYFVYLVRWQLVEGANGRRAFRRLYNTSVIWSNIYNLVDWFLPHFYQLSTKWHLC